MNLAKEKKEFTREDIIKQQSEYILSEVEINCYRRVYETYLDVILKNNPESEIEYRNGRSVIIPYEDYQRLLKYDFFVIINKNCNITIKNYDLILEKLKELLENTKWINVNNDIFRWVLNSGLHRIISCIICELYNETRNWTYNLFEFVSNPKEVNTWIEPVYTMYNNRDFKRLEKILEKKNESI